MENLKTNLKHVRANVRDLEKAVEWYKNTLGFQVAAIWPPEEPNYVHFEHESGAMFALLEHENAPSYGRFNFYVADLEALWNETKEKVEVVEGFFDTDYGTKKFTILDLDGNELSFVQDE